MERPEHIWFLLSRNLSGEASQTEHEELMQALQQQPALMQQYELLQRLWKPRQTVPTEEITARVNQILQRSASEVPDTREQPDQQPIADLRVAPVRKLWRGIRRWSGAAAVVGILLAVYVQHQKTPAVTVPENEIVAKKGSKTRTLLPDGSTVWLNAGSSITYDPAFTGNAREVTLQGEGYFDIVKQAGKPFIVHAGDINIRVLGTAFNVKSYDEEPTIETTLIHGLIQITRKADSTGIPIFLHPNQKIVLPKSAPLITEPMTKPAVPSPARVQPAIVHLDSSLKENERLETAWMYNRLEFRGDSFAELAKKLERWYNITIHFQDEEVRNLVFNGSLENETVEQAFQALTLATAFRFDIKGNDVYIRSANKN
ncbi:FecR family protein [Paraflavitalea pollutisoli]|uniref:FecR family protein n=1 Tax=Paraflavitalea pollutisoli TaxID=3034143 RepID=UPI0023EC2B65|nr:FecR domain-containing protein [Paraflavitalea sp. H1-2-19X]